jgi:DNA-binding transcriptional LysR family regulator
VEALRQACLGGLGIALLSAWDVLATGKLMAVPLQNAELAALAIWAVYPTATEARGLVQRIKLSFFASAPIMHILEVSSRRRAE